MVEALNKALEERLGKVMRKRRVRNVNDRVLADVVNNYNTTYHSVIKNKPIDAFSNSATKEEIRFKREPQKFHVGDKVRVRLSRKGAVRGDRRAYFYNWDDEYIGMIGRVIRTDNGRLMYYIYWPNEKQWSIQPLYAEDLQLIEARRNND